MYNQPSTPHTLQIDQAAHTLSRRHRHRPHPHRHPRLLPIPLPNHPILKRQMPRPLRPFNINPNKRPRQIPPNTHNRLLQPRNLTIARLPPHRPQHLGEKNPLVPHIQSPPVLDIRFPEIHQPPGPYRSRARDTTVPYPQPDQDFHKIHRGRNQHALQIIREPAPPGRCRSGTDFMRVDKPSQTCDSTQMTGFYIRDVRACKRRREEVRFAIER